MKYTVRFWMGNQLILLGAFDTEAEAEREAEALLVRGFSVETDRNEAEALARSFGL